MVSSQKTVESILNASGMVRADDGESEKDGTVGSRLVCPRILCEYTPVPVHKYDARKGGMKCWLLNPANRCAFMSQRHLAELILRNKPLAVSPLFCRTKQSLRVAKQSRNITGSLERFTRRCDPLYNEYLCRLPIFILTDADADIVATDTAISSLFVCRPSSRRKCRGLLERRESTCDSSRRARCSVPRKPCLRTSASQKIATYIASLLPRRLG